MQSARQSCSILKLYIDIDAHPVGGFERKVKSWNSTIKIVFLRFNPTSQYLVTGKKLAFKVVPCFASIVLD